MNQRRSALARVLGLTLRALPLLALPLLPVDAAGAQNRTPAGQGHMNPGKRVPFIAQTEPPRLTVEQQRQRDEAMARTNLPGPPLPEGTAPELRRNVPQINAGAPQSNRSAEGDGAKRAPGDFRFFRTSAQSPYTTGTSTIAETHGGTSGPVVFYTGNWFASYSANGGASWTFVNPYTQFPSLDAGFCCDQTVILDRSHNMVAWQLQYSYSATTQRGSWRTAFANASSVASGGWCYYDWSPASFGLPAGLWLDYPHVALSSNFIWYTANVYNAAGSWQDTLIFRVPLGPVSTCSGFNYQWFVVTDRFNFTPTQGAFGTMYWASHNSTSSERVYHWDEASGTIFWNDVTISTWPRNLPYQCAGSDGQNWCGRGPNDGRIQTGWVAGGVIGFMFNASQNGTVRPYPYVHVARFRQSDITLIDQPIIWNTAHAWQYPAIGVNDRGHIAGSLYWGGGSFNPTMNILISDDLSPGWGENYGLVASSQGAAAWGDWYASRRHATYGTTWIATGEARTSTGSVNSWYAWFGRERDTPPSLTVSPATSMAFTGLAGGPFTPSSSAYSLFTTVCCSGPSWSITGVPSWLTATQTFGTIGTASQLITVIPNSTANGLPPGTYLATINFNNTSSGLGNTTRSASLTVRPRPTLFVKPEDKQVAEGPKGGPFTPDRIIYKLFTDKGTASWKLNGLPDWLNSKQGTTGTVGTDKDKVVLVLNGKAIRLGRGTYRADLVFKNLTNSNQSPLDRTVVLKVGVTSLRLSDEREGEP
jgi:hypothetical protein